MNRPIAISILIVVLSGVLGYYIGLRYMITNPILRPATIAPLVNGESLEWGAFRILRVDRQLAYAVSLNGNSEEEIRLDSSLLLGKRRTMNPGDQIECLFCNAPRDGKVPRAVVNAAKVLGFENREDPPGLAVTKNIPTDAKCVVLMRDIVSGPY